MPVPFLKVRDGQCRFPIGDPLSDGFAFCGAPIRPRSSYCAACHALAYEPSTPRVGAPRDPMVLLRHKASDDPVELTGVLV